VIFKVRIVKPVVPRTETPYLPAETFRPPAPKLSSFSVRNRSGLCAMALARTIAIRQTRRLLHILVQKTVTASEIVIPSEAEGPAFRFFAGAASLEISKCGDFDFLVLTRAIP
jgi:hypothetical protein